MINIRTQKEVDLIRQSCAMVVEALDLAERIIKPGITTLEIDEAVDGFIESKGAKAAFKGYNGFPASACISVEDEVVHGIPGSRTLKEGEIVSIDIGVYYQGFFGDSARTIAVGKIASEKQHLLDITRKSLADGVNMAASGSRLSDISHAIQKTVEAAEYAVVRDLVGHGIGRSLHEDPQIPNYGAPNAGPRLRAGMVLAIEPMVNMGTYKVKTQSDDWTVVTADGLPSAHFEHTVAITDNGPEILTLVN